MKILPCATLVVFTLLCANASRGATTLLNDNFTESSRSNPANLPNSTPYFYSNSTASNLAISGGMLNFVTGTSSSGLFLGYFNSQALNVGDSLTLSFTFKANGIVSAANGTRIGLFSSGGSYISADNYTTASNTFLGYKGYGTFGNLGGTTTNGSVLVRRDASTTNNALLTNSAPLPISGSSGKDANLTSGMTYTALLTIINNGANATVKFTLNDSVLSVNDTADYASFDTLAILSNTQDTSMNFSNISVTYQAAVPEPSTLIGALGSVGVFFAAGWLNRRRRRMAA